MSEVHQIPFGVRTPYIPSGLETVRFPETLGAKIEVVVATSLHAGFERALELEHDTFVSLGDKSTDDNDKEFQPYDSISTFAYAYLADTPFSKLNNDNLVGMARFIPWTAEYGLKTISDLAKIPFTTNDIDTKNQIVDSAIKGSQVDRERLGYADIYRLLVGRLCVENLACREDLIVDIATLAPSFEIQKNIRMSTNLALLGTSVLYLLAANRELSETGYGFSHATQFTETKLHKAMNSLGYPSASIAGLTNILYDTNGDGIAMRADPQVTSAEEIKKVVTNSQGNTHLGTIKSIYERL